MCHHPGSMRPEGTMVGISSSCQIYVYFVLEYSWCTMLVGGAQHLELDVYRGTCPLWSWCFGHTAFYSVLLSRVPWAAQELLAGDPVLYIYVYTLRPTSWNIPSPGGVPSVTLSGFLKWVCSFVSPCISVADPTYQWYRAVFLCFVHLVVTGSFPVAANGIISTLSINHSVTFPRIQV